MKNRVIICEASEMIAIGLAEIIDSMAQFDVVARLDSPEHLSEKLVATEANLLIVNPALLGFHGKEFLSQLGKEHPNVVTVALVASCLDQSNCDNIGVFLSKLQKEFLAVKAKQSRIDNQQVGFGGHQLLGEMLGTVEMSYHVELRHAVDDFGQADSNHLRGFTNDDTVLHGWTFSRVST